MKRIRLTRRKQIQILGMAFTALVILQQLDVKAGARGWLNRLEYVIYDIRFPFGIKPQPKSEHNIVIVDVDEDSLISEGRWPWSRSKIATLVDKLAQAGAVVIAFDMVFAEPERNPVDQVLSRVAKGSPLLDPLTELHPQLDGDIRLAKSLGNTDVILGYFFQQQHKHASGQLVPPLITLTEEQQADLVVHNAEGYSAPLPLLVQNSLGGGFVSTFPDADGIIRRSPLLIRHNEGLYPSLALSAGLAYLFVESVELNTETIDEVLSVTSVGFGERPANTDVKAQVIVPYIGKQKSFPYISASHVLHGLVSEGQLENAVVFVGTSAIGLSDLRVTPLETQYPGVEVHANILKALLEGSFPYKPDWEMGLVIPLLFFLGIFLSLFLPRLEPTSMVAWGIIAIGLCILGNFYLWSELKLDLSLASLVILVAGLLMVNFANGFFREATKRHQLKGMFGQYVPAAHIDKMINKSSEVALSGEQKELTVLFSDIRSFTSISENLSAVELKTLLNEYFTPITEIIFNHDGTIDKYVGDMVMAFWGAPLDDENHRENALLAALKMLEETARLRKVFKKKGLPEISIGVGLNTGVMNVGDMGSTYRRAYTVLGDAVNLGSRLESLTKFYGIDLLVGPKTCDGLDHFAFRHIDRLQVKGKDEPVDVFQPLGLRKQLNPLTLDALKDYHKARNLYLQQDWQAARAEFEKLVTLDPQCRLYLIYLERIAGHLSKDVGDDWDGTYRHTSK